ncbi:TPA: hypothetical protein ACH3X3_006183 [Trebouxia sp. C0006]
MLALHSMPHVSCLRPVNVTSASVRSGADHVAILRRTQSGALTGHTLPTPRAKHVRRGVACNSSADLKRRWIQGAVDYRDRSAEGIMRLAEGGAYGEKEAGGNSFSYWFLAVVFAGAAAFAAVAPHMAAELLFGSAGRPHDYLQEALFRLLAVGFVGAASQNWILKDAARDGFLDEAIFRRANISLAMLAGTNLFFLASTFISNPIYPSSPLLPTAALALGAININQLWVSGINFVKYSPEGFNTFKIFKSFFMDLKSLSSVSGLNSGIYSALTASFVLAGLIYIGLPSQTLTAIFGSAAEKGLEDIFLWQLIGTAVSMAVAPIAFTQQEAANQNNFSDPSKRTLMTGLAAASAAHVAVFLPLLGTSQSGPLLFPVGFIWGVSAVASGLIAIKPKE